MTKDILAISLAQSFALVGVVAIAAIIVVGYGSAINSNPNIASYVGLKGVRLNIRPNTIGLADLNYQPAKDKSSTQSSAPTNVALDVNKIDPLGTYAQINAISIKQ